MEDCDTSRLCHSWFRRGAGDGVSTSPGLICVTPAAKLPLICNLSSVTKGKSAIRDLFRVVHDRTGNLPPMPGIFPDYSAPIVRVISGDASCDGAVGHAVAAVRPQRNGWTVDLGVTNVRNVASPHWRRWLGVESRCVVQFISFSEYDADLDGKKLPIWFALEERRPLAAFAGIWTKWTSVRKAREGAVTCDVFAFLTTEPNADVAPIHPKAMPMIPTTPEESQLRLMVNRRRRSNCKGHCRTTRYGSWRRAREQMAIPLWAQRNGSSRRIADVADRGVERLNWAERAGWRNGGTPPERRRRRDPRYGGVSSHSLRAP